MTANTHLRSQISPRTSIPLSLPPYAGSLKQEQPHTNSSDAATELTVPETVPESCAPLDESNPIIGAYMDLMRDDDSMDWLSAVELQERCNEGQALNPEPCVGKPIASAEVRVLLLSVRRNTYCSMHC